MNKRISSILIIVIFLSVQTLFLLHASEHVFEKHEHNGKVCDICLSAENNKLLSSNFIKFVTPDLFTLEVSLLKETVFFSGKVQFFYSRAPPFFLI